MKKLLKEIKSATDSVARGLGMFGILCLAFILGVLSLTGTDDFLD